MSKSLQKGIIFAVCIALVCALGVTLFLADGTGMVPSVQEGQASAVESAVEQNTATYTHGSQVKTAPSGVRQVNKGTDFVDAVSKNQNISITGSFELTSSQSFLKKDNNGNISDDPATSGSALVYSGTIYGNGYNITIAGSQAITDKTAAWDCGPKGYADAANIYGGLVGKLTGQIYDLNVTMKSGTMEKIKGNDGGDRWLDVGVIAGIVDDVNARIENCSVTIPANTQITALKSKISRPGLGQSSAGTQYVRAAGIAAELNNGTIVNCTVTNNGCISAGLQEDKDDNSITNGYYGAAANAVAWVNNGTLNNIIVKGSGKLIGLKTAAISVVNNSNISPTTNAYNGYTGTYEFSHGDDGGNWSTASMYVSGARQAIANFYQASNATTSGGANKDQTSHELANSGTTLTVNPSTYTIYFDPTKSSDDTRLAVLFNNENYSEGAEYELYGASRQISNAQISGANGKVLARNLPASPDTWNSGNNFTASVQIAFNPTSYAALTKYDHGYVSGGSPSGTPIGTGEDFEDEFSPSGTISGTDYYLTNDIVITGFTGKEFSGTLDGNGHTIFITGANTCAAQHIGGIVGTLTGTIKNVRVVLVNSVTANTSVSNANVGLVAGHINGGSLINVSVDIPADVTLKHTDSGNDSSLGGIAGSAVSGATFTNVTMNFNGTLSNIKTSGASGGYWPFTSAFVGKPYFKDSANSSADCATFNNIIIRGNGTFASQSSADDEPPYYAAIGIIQHKGVTNSTAAVYNVNGLIYDFNPQFANDQGATTGNHGACYGLFVNNNNNNATQVQYYDRLVNYGSNGVYNASGAVIEAYAFNDNGNAPVPNPSKIKNITETVTGVDGSAVKAYFMPGDSASENLTLVASASNWNGVTQLQLDGAAPAVTSADDGSNKVVNVAKSTAVNISGENLTLSPYNPYTVITASLVTDTKVYDGNPFAAQVSFAVGGSPVSLTDGQYTITYTDGNATGETNANVGDGTYSLTVTLKGTASDGTQYVFDAQGTKTKTFTYTITPLEVTGTWSVRGLEITYGDAAPDYDQYISIELTNEGTIPGGLTATDITGSGFTSNYTSGTRAGETVTITAGTFTVGSGFTASNYNFSGITGSGSVEVQKREITISAAADLEPDAAGHIVVTYGGENYVNSQDSLAALLTWAEIGGFVNGRYGTDEIGFTITQVAHEGDTEAPGTAVDSGEWAKLPANDRYYITVESTNSNYTVAQGNYFTYYIAPAELTIDSVVWSGTNNNTTIYNGSAQTFTVNARGLVEGDNLEDVISTSVTYNNVVHSGNIINAGTYTITVNPAQDPSNYDLRVDVENTYDLTISPITLTINDVNAVYTDITAAEVVIAGMVIGILEGDSEGVTIDVVWDTTPADENGYLAAGTYNATLSLSGDKSANYTFGSDDIATVTVDKFDLSGAHIIITSEQFTYDGNEQTVLYTVLTAEDGKDITALLTAEGDKQTNAGDAYTLTLTGGNNFTNQATATWSIGKAKLSVTAPTDITFMDKAASELSDYLTTGNWITGFFESDGYSLGAWNNDPEESAVIIGDVAYAAAGTYTAAVQLTGENADTNYELSASTLSVTVNKLDISGEEVAVTWKEDLTYNAEKQSVSLASVTVSGVVMPVEWFTPQNNTGTDADTYTATVAASNANIEGSVSKDFTIAPVAVTVKWEAAGEISVGTAMPADATDMSALDLTARVTEFNAPGITETAQYSIVVTASGFDAGHSFAAGDKVTLTPSMTFAEGVKAGNYQITYAPETIVKTATAISVEVSPPKEPVSVTYGDSVTSADGFISKGYFTIMSGAEGSALTPDNFTVTVTDENGAAVFDSMHGLDAGTYTVTIEGKGAYSVSNENNYFTYTVAPLTLTAGTWSGLDELKYSGNAAVPGFTLKGVLNGDNVAVGYTIEGDNATDGQAINAGKYTATAKLEGDDAGNYEFDGVVNVKEFTIEQMVLQGGLTVDPDLTYDGTSKAGKVTLTWTSAPLKEGDVTANITFTKGGEKADPIAAGDYIAIVTLTDNTGNYDTTEITSTVDFTIAPKSIGVAWTNTELIYNGLAQVPTATATGLVGGDSLTLTVTGEQTNAGSYTATVAAFEQGNYKLAKDATIEFTIAPKSIGVAWTNTAFEYDGAPHKPTATATGLVGDDSLTLNVTGEQTNAGSYTATVAAFEQGNYKLAEEATIKFTIARKTVSVAWGNTEFTYNGSAQKPNATVGEGLVSGDDLQITVRGEQTNAGDDYTATAEITGGEDMGNYVLDGSASTSFTIAPKSIGVEWTNTEFTYDGTAHKPTATATELVGEDTLTLTVTGEQTNANAEGETYTATVKAFIDGNYKLEQDATVEFTIAPKTVSVEWTNTAFTYNGSAQKPNATVGVLDGDNVSVGYTIEGDKATDGQAINAGSYTVTAEITGGEDMGNYVLDESSASTSFTIAPKPITITFTANDGANPINFDVAGSVTVGAWTIDGGNAGRATLVLSDGTTDITLTVEAASGEDLPTKENVPALLLLLGSELYVGTPYGTKVEGGSLTVISADTNYVFEGAQAITLNITPAISVGLKADVETERGLTDVLKTAHNADYFKNNYLQVTGKDGAEVTGGTLEVTITPSEGLEEGAIKHAGTYTVKAVYTPAGAGNGAEKPTFSFEFIVTPVEVTSVTYSGEPLVYGDLSESGVIAVTVEYADGKKAENVTAQYTSENVSTARYVKAGEQTIKVSYTNDDSDYAAVTEHEIKLTVEKKTITPSAISYGGVTSEGTTLTLTYAGKSAYAGNLVIEPVGILSRDVVEFISEKDYSAANEEGYTPQIRIYESGDGGNYTLDLNGWKVVVLKKTIEVTVNADSYTYTGSAIKLTASSEEIVGEDDVTFTVSGENVNVVDQTVTNAGTYDLTVTLGGEQGGNYEVAGEPSVTIGKAGVEIVWTNETELESAVYNGQPYEVKVDVRFNGQSVGSASIKYTSDEVTVTEAVNAGSYTAEATFAGTDNFNATTASYDFTIAKMVLNGEWKVASDMNMTYDGTSKEGYATWTWTTEPVNESDVTVGYKYELGGAIVDDVIDAGNYNVYAVFTGNTGNYDIKSDIFELTVARRAVTVKWSESVSFTYNGSAQAPAATAQNVVEGDSLTLTVTGAKKDVGTYKATVAAASVTGNYVLAGDASTDFTIAPKSIGVEWGDTAFTYNGSAQKPTATATDLVDGDSLTLTVTGAQTNAGSYEATVKAFEQGNYKLEKDNTQAFTIAKADLTVTPASLEIRERETDVMQAFAEGEDLEEAFAGRISVSGVSGTVSYTVTIAGDNNYDDDGLLTVGAHTFTIDAGGNYNAASVSVTVIATPVVTVIASVEGELVYNGSAFEISYALKEGAPVDVSMDDITVTASVETIVNAGEYEVTFTVTGSNEDYDYVVQDASGNAALTFTIARRGLDVAEVAEAVYGNLQVSGTLVTGTHTAFVAYNDEEIELIVNVKTAALSRAAAEYLDAGEYEVTIALANEQGNFSLNGATLNAETERMEVQSTLDVAPKTIEVGYKPSSPDYDAKGISLTLEKFEDMLIEGDDPAVNIYINDAPYTGKVVLDAGEYTVRYESADPNYAFTPVSATFTVAPKSVTPNFDLNTGSGSLQITGGGKLEIEEGEETDIVAAIDNFMQSSGVPEEDMSISVSGDLKLEDMATWAPGTYTVTVTLSGNHSGSMQFTVEVSEKVELPPPVEPELPETPVEAGSGNDWVLPLVIAIVALIDLALLVAIGVAAKKRA